jgi:hypothetical protein
MGQVVFKMSSDEAAAVNGFMRLVDAQKKVNREVTKGGKAGKLFNQGLKGGLNSNVRVLGKMLASVVSIGAAIGVGRRAWRLFKDDIRDSVNSMKQFQNAFIQLQFLGDNYKSPGLRKKIHGLAKSSGVGAGEIALGANALQSMTGYLDGKGPAAAGKIRGRMLSELTRLRKTTPATIDQMTPMFAKMRSFYPGLTARGQSNITNYMIEQAGVSNVGELTPVAPKMFSAGKIGGMDARTAAGMGSFMTHKTGSAAEAATAMRRISLKLMLKDPDEAEAIRSLAFGATDPTAGRKNLMKNAGVVSGDNAYQRILKIAELNKTSPLSVQSKKDLVGERGAAQLNALLENPEALDAMVQRFKAKTGPQFDMVGKKLAAVSGGDATYRAIEAGKRGQAGIAAAQQRPANLLWENFDTSLQRIRKESGGGFGSYLDLGMSMRKAETQNFLGADVKDNLTKNLANALRSYGYIDENLPFAEKNAKAEAMAERWLGITENMGAAAATMKEAAESIFNVPDRNAHTN